MTDEWKMKVQMVRDHLASTKEDEWCVDVVRTKDQKQNCLFGHVFNMGKDDKEGNEWWQFFECCVATTFMVYPINDGSDDRYQQPTPKQRCLAYIDDILSGREDSALEMLEDY